MDAPSLTRIARPLARPAARALAAACVAALLVGARAEMATAPSLRAAAPFAALAVGHVGRPYADHVRDAFDAPVRSYRLVSGTLPGGLALDGTTGEVRGTPQEARVARLRIAATPVAGGAELEVRASVAILSANEAEVRRGQSFEAQGPQTVRLYSSSFTWTSSFDGRARPATVYIYVPSGPAGRLPLLVFHRGRGFGHDDYGGLLSRVASHGVICASVSDEQSFASPRAPSSAERQYDSTRPELGMESASAAQEATLDHLLGIAARSGNVLSGRIDAEEVFFAGHSRGGGATHASHARSIPLRAKGAIYFMAFDLRFFSQTAPPGVAPAYPIATSQARLPSLVISAEEDGDLVYPIADELIDRATGPTTFVTVYGAIHNYLGDRNPAEATARITRAEQQARIASFVVAFIRRWAQDDVSLEGFLYGDEHATSTRAGVASWRRSSPTLLVDDFQDADPTRNVLGGANTVSGLTRSEQPVYPSTGSFSSLGLRHSILTFRSASSSLRLSLGGTGVTRDVSGHRVLLARVLQTAGTGYRLGMWLRLTDGAGRSALVKVAAENGSSLGFLPARTTTSAPALDRFLTLSVPLVRFTQATPSLDLRSIASIDVVFNTPSERTSRQVAIDDVRFE